MTMARLFVIPAIRIGAAICPKYLKGRVNAATEGLEGATWEWASYLLEDCGVIAVEGTAAQYAQLAAFADVVAVPANLDGTIGAGAVATVQARLEGWNLPANWIVAGMTYRSIIRTVLGFILLHRRLVGRVGARLFDGSITLSTTVAQIPSGIRSHLIGAANDLGVDVSGLSGSSTLREVFRAFAQGIESAPMSLGGVQV